MGEASRRVRSDTIWVGDRVTQRRTRDDAGGRVDIVPSSIVYIMVVLVAASSERSWLLM